MRNRALKRILRYPGTPGILLFLVMAVVDLSVEPRLLSAYNLSSMAQVSLPLILGTFAQTLVMIAGGLDLSIGGVMGLTNAIIAVAAPVVGLGGAIALSLAAGALVGLVNGFVIGVLRVQALVATLATYFAASGAALLVLPTPGGSVPDALMSLYRSRPMGIPVAVLPVVVILLIWFFARLRYGRWLFALGGHERNARRNGVPVLKVRFATYVCAGILASLAGVALTGEIASGDPHSGTSYLLSTVAATVLGGTSLAGGYGSLVGSVGGALSLSLISHIVFFANVPWYFQSIVSSTIVLGGIALAAALLRVKPGSRLA